MRGELKAADKRARNRPVSFFPDDLDRIESIRRHYGDDSFSKAVRRAVEMVSRIVGPDSTDERKAA